ncbi:MAG: YcgN family cysteine cluster protein [Pseudomonadota bacterium]
MTTNARTPGGAHADGAAPFWERKSLEQMTRDEWESLCDGCGKCCLVKLIDDDTDELIHTRVACTLLDIGACRCSNYARRHQRVPDCIRLDPAAITELDWLPETCAYRRVQEGRGLAWWHPLVSGDPSTVHAAGVSVRSFAISEDKVDHDYAPYFLKSAP